MRGPLKGRLVFVEVFNEDGNISASFHTLVERLGGTVAPSFKKNVKFLIWRLGREWIWKKARKYNITTVTPLWLDACDNEEHLADPKSFLPKDPDFDLLTKRPRRAFTSPGRNLPAAKRQRPITASAPRELHPALSATKAKIDFSDTSGSEEDESERKVFICGTPNIESELESNLKLLRAHPTLKPGNAAAALILDPDAVKDIAVALSFHLPLLSMTWLEESVTAQSWLDPQLFHIPKLQLDPGLFKGLRFALDQAALDDGLVPRLLEAGGGKVVTHPREGDYYVTDGTAPKLPSHIKVMDSEWVSKCVIEGQVLKTRTGAVGN